MNLQKHLTLIAMAVGTVITMQFAESSSAMAKPFSLSPGGASDTEIMAIAIGSIMAAVTVFDTHMRRKAVAAIMPPMMWPCLVPVRRAADHAMR